MGGACLLEVLKDDISIDVLKYLHEDFINMKAKLFYSLATKESE